MTATAVLGLWLPWAIAAHVFAAIWVLKTLFVSRAAYRRKQKGANSAQAVVLPATGTLDPQQDAGGDTCITVADFDTIDQQGLDQYSGKDPDHGSKVQTAASEQRAVHLSFSIEWQDIGCKYSTPVGQKTVLEGIWGRASPGEMQVSPCWCLLLQ